MELQLKMLRKKGEFLPINYQYLISSWIYRVFNSADGRFSAFLHDTGYCSDGRNFKMFTFSQLNIRPYTLEQNRIRLLGREIALTLRFLVDKSSEHFVKGLFMNQIVTLGNSQDAVTFEITTVTVSNPVVFSPVMRYYCLSPICVSCLRPDGGTEYLHPADRQYGNLLVQNLVRKAKALQLACGETEQTAACSFRLLNAPRKKGIHIKEGTQSHTQVIGYLFKYELEAPTELQEIGYYAGFGEKNSLGFGCGEVMR